MRTTHGATAVNIAKTTNLSAFMIDTFLVATAPNDKLERSDARGRTIPKKPYDQFHTDMSPGG